MLVKANTLVTYTLSLDYRLEDSDHVPMYLPMDSKHATFLWF
jgi:hypothetical protein